MSKLILNNIILSKNICYLIIYLLIFIFSLVLVSDNLESISLVLKFILEQNNFISFILIPVSLMISFSVLSIINNNLLIMERFKNKRELTKYIVKILVISIIIIDIIVLLFALLFILILKTTYINFDYLLALTLNLILNSILIGLFVLILKVYINKYIVIFITLLASAFIFAINIDLSTTINNISLIALIIKLSLISLEYIFVIKKYPKMMYSGVYR